MSRSTYAPKESYTGTGSLAAYSFDFKIEALTQLEIVEYNTLGVETQRVRGTDTSYLSSVTFDAINGGGTVTLAANLTTNYKLVLLLANDDPTQSYEFRNKGSFTLRRIEGALDFILGAVQRLAYRGKQSLRINDYENEETIDTQLPAGLADNAGAVVKVNSAGNGFEYGPTSDSLATGGLPNGGAAGAVLKKSTITDQDTEWESMDFSGYSARFTEAFSSTGLTDTINKILDLSYVTPSVVLTAAGSTTVREKGTAVTSVLLSASVTKTTDPIARVNFKRDGTSIDDNVPPTDTGTAVETHTYSTSFSDNTTFSVEVTDDGTSGGPSTVSNSKSFTFVYPYFYGVGAAGLTAAQVAALTKDIRTENTNYNRSFGSTTSQVYYFAYPASYGTLSSILDENGFETISDWTLTVSNITALDASSVSYNIYEFDNVVSAAATNYVFAQ